MLLVIITLVEMNIFSILHTYREKHNLPEILTAFYFMQICSRQSVATEYKFLCVLMQTDTNRADSMNWLHS